MWYARKVLNSRHEQIPQGIALEYDLLLLTFKYRTKIILFKQKWYRFLELKQLITILNQTKISRILA